MGKKFVLIQRFICFIVFPSVVFYLKYCKSICESELSEAIQPVIEMWI